MLTPPAISADTIIACLRERYGLHVARATFLPIGADINTAVFRLETDDNASCFLKLRRGDFDEVAVAVPAFLHAQGIREVMAPLPTADQRLWASGHGFDWILYPFFNGHDGYEGALSEAQWVALGRSLKAVHSTTLPPALGQRVPRESYSPRWRDVVRRFDQEVSAGGYEDPISQKLAAFWVTKRPDILIMVERAEQLGETLRQRTDAFVLCHADMHPGNVLLGADDELAIVDWDNPIFAPKERDLMCLGGGVSTVWSDAREEALFYQGYGSTEIDPVALSYYRYERIVADVAAYGAQIFGIEGNEEDRENGLRQLMSQFLPGHVVAVAHSTYERPS
ncbi:MAG: phosphotransferase enzyme family protein [Nitrososphaerota archaeon]